MSRLAEHRPQTTVLDLARKVGEGGRLVMLTAYDAPTAHIADAAGVDMILVGDSVGNVCLGFENTLPVSVAMMNHHLEAVARTQPKAFLVADMPYLSCRLGVEEALRTACGFLQRGAQAVKVEGGRTRLDLVKALVEADVPVMAHLGLMPQSVHAMGGYKVQGREAAGAVRLLEDALALEAAGAFSVLLEGVPADLAAAATRLLKVPTIGIGAGPDCSGQVLVFHDLLGLLPGPRAKFVRTYLEGLDLCTSAISNWINDIQTGNFPGPRESYMLSDEVLQAVRAFEAPRSESSGRE